MSDKIKHFIERILTNTAQQLQLCCSHALGNIPSEMLRRNGRGAER